MRGPLQAETGQSASVEVSRTQGPLSYRATFFASRIHNPVWVNQALAYVLENLPRPTTNVGMELLATWRRAPFSVTANYVYVQAREYAETAYQDVPLTPRYAFGLVGVWERENVARIGAECYYTGVQRLEANPFSTESEPYTLVGLLLERVFGPVRVFVNGENLLNFDRHISIRWFARRKALTDGGQWVRGRPLTGGTSTAEFD